MNNADFTKKKKKKRILISILNRHQKSILRKQQCWFKTDIVAKYNYFSFSKNTSPFISQPFFSLLSHKFHPPKTLSNVAVNLCVSSLLFVFSSSVVHASFHGFFVRALLWVRGCLWVLRLWDLLSSWVPRHICSFVRRSQLRYVPIFKLQVNSVQSPIFSRSSRSDFCLSCLLADPNVKSSFHIYL